MKNKCAPVFGSKRKMGRAIFVLGLLLIISVACALIIQNEVISILLLLPFAGAFWVAICLYMYDAIAMKKRYDIVDGYLIAYAPLKKNKKVFLNDIAAILIVAHTYSVKNVVIHPVIRDIDNKTVLDVILLKEGYPEHLINVDDSYCLMENCRGYVLYDFVFDSESVLQLLKDTSANILASKSNYDFLISDEFFQCYSTRIKQKDLKKSMMMKQ